MSKKEIETTAETTEVTEIRTNIVKARVLGFNPRGKSCMLNTQPNLDIWVNTQAEYDQYLPLARAKEVAEFVPRMVDKRDGGKKRVYALNVAEISADALEEIFNRTFDPVAESNDENKPF